MNGNTAGVSNGGIGNFGTLSLSNTIIATNTGGDCAGNVTVTDLGYNLVEDGSCITDLTSFGGDPLLGPLKDNGGPTLTHAIDDTSPAFDKIPVLNGSCNDTGITSDQRGVARPQGTACDIGAFELVTNQAPTADPNGPYLVAVNDDLSLDSSGSTDPDGDALTPSWTVAGGSVSGETYSAGPTPGIYDACLVVNDGFVDSEAACTMVVVYDPSGGFVTGGGWILSPEGAYPAEPGLTGKASFGFVAKYKKGANVPEGNTQFQFQAGDLSFHSTSYEWLVVAGTKAKFKGEGTLNGSGHYGFMLTANDDSPDSFRLKLWDKDDDTLVYDNQPGDADEGYTGTDLGGGNIVVHKGK